MLGLYMSSLKYLKVQECLLAQIEMMYDNLKKIYEPFRWYNIAYVLKKNYVKFVLNNFRFLISNEKLNIASIMFIIFNRAVGNSLVTLFKMAQAIN